MAQKLLPFFKYFHTDLNGLRNIARIAFLNVGNLLAGGRIDRLKRFTALRIVPLVVDKNLEAIRLKFRISQIYEKIIRSQIHLCIFGRLIPYWMWCWDG